MKLFVLTLFLGGLSFAQPPKDLSIKERALVQRLVFGSKDVAKAVGGKKILKRQTMKFVDYLSISSVFKSVPPNSFGCDRDLCVAVNLTEIRGDNILLFAGFEIVVNLTRKTVNVINFRIG